MTLKLCPDLEIPRDAVSRTFGVLAVRGAGKSNTAAVMAEEMFAARLPFVVVDPVGSWFGLRSNTDGTGAGLPIPIFGGKHGDIPIDRNAGELLADLIVEKRLSCVLDLSRFGSEADKKYFLLKFAQRLYEKNEDPLHLFLEEADDYIPQKPMRDEAQLLRAWENIVRRGRARGLGMTIITQRSAAVNKMVLTQVETLIAMRTTGPQDIAAIEAWVKYHDVKGELLASLSSLADGDAWVWSPQFLGITKRVHIRRRRTFDSGATPKNLEASQSRRPATLADVDLKAIHFQMAATIERTKADDPKELKKEIIALKKEIAGLRQHKCATAPEVREVSILTDEDRKLLTSAVQSIREQTGRCYESVEVWFGGVRRGMDEIGELLRSLGERMGQRIATEVPFHPRKPQPSPVRPKQNFSQPKQNSGVGDSALGKCERAILQVLAQYSEGCDAGKLTLLTGYRYGGGYRNSLGKLRTAGFIEGENTGIMTITEAGLRQGPFEPLPAGEELRDYWRNHRSFGMCERKILEALIDFYPKGLNADQLCERTGYQYGGGFRNSLGKLRTVGVLVGRNTETMMASETLFEG